ncbi:cation:dicarboxylase symporter family transporter [Clostridium sp. SHJSY1]|uniref:cation:dicarboxylate symporter family transporter n=1 Tax=Clostridium sp. SHJSY1 TaxID=2942483 RepID=UPI002874EB43|nr:cation:dicarboxylase symporter family transporter [Clostridium sp. SHJSY1]MDS0526421.1 cation:dicarboxylase symporter family transporter [Clostridium sp. SHJSY1]
MDSTFFTNFIMLTSINTILFIVILIGIFFGARILEKKKFKFSTRMIISTLIGLILGLVIQLVAGFPNDVSEVKWISEVIKWYSLFGNGFMSLLKMLVVPLVFLSILKVIINMKEQQSLGKITGRSMFVLLGTTAIASIVAIIIGSLFKLGVGAESVQGKAEMKEVSSFVDTLLGLLPSNPVKAMADANIVAVVIFAAFIGIAIKRLNKKHSEIIKPAVDLIEAFYKIMTSVAMTVIKFMPYAVIPLLANTIAGKGISAILNVVNFIIALYISVIIVFIIHLVIIALNGLNPIKYVKNVIEPLILAFTSRSSLGTLPVTIETLTNKVGVENGISSFAGSLGANIGMNGCAAIYPALMSITIANMSGTPMDFSFYAMLVVIIVISSLGIAGLPGTAIMSVSVVISGMGMGSYFPLAGAILAIDPILDMGRTALNVNGSMVAAVTVSNSLNELDKEIFNNN